MSNKEKAKYRSNRFWYLTLIGGGLALANIPIGYLLIGLAYALPIIEYGKN